MAKKKVTEETVTETISEIVETPIVEETPKATKKKSTKKKVEESVDEQVPDLSAVEEEVKEDVNPIKAYFDKLDEKSTEPPIVFEAVEVVEEKPKKVKKVKAEKVEEPTPIAESTSELPYKAKVTASIIHSRKGPGMSFHTARDLYKGTMVVVSAIEGNWGKIGKDLWVNINYIEKI